MSVSDALRAPLSLCQRLLQYQLNISNLMRADGEKECVMGAITGNDNTVHSVSSCPYLEIGIHVLIIPHPS